MREFEKFTGLTQAIENLAWIKTYRPVVEKWIAENYKNPKQKEDVPNSASSFTLASLLVIIPVLLARFN